MRGWRRGLSPENQGNGTIAPMASKEDDFARNIGMSPTAFSEALDLYDGKYPLNHIRRTLRTEFQTVLTNRQWAAIKQFHADNNKT